MKYRVLSLALSGALALTLLAGCAGNGTANTPPLSTPSSSPAVSEDLPSQLPSDSPDPSVSPETSLTPDASQAPDASGSPAVSQAPSARPSSKPSTTPSSKPSATPKPTAKPQATPAPTPTPSQPQANVVTSIWNEIATQDLPTLMDVDAATLSALYGIDSSSLVSYVCKIPMMAVHATEFFIAEVKDGQMETVKAGVLKRQAALEQQWSSYLPEQYELVKNYQLVTNGNYILFAISEHNDVAVNAFNSYTK